MLHLTQRELDTVLGTKVDTKEHELARDRLLDEFDLQLMLTKACQLSSQEDRDILFHPDSYPGFSAAAISPDGSKYVIINLKNTDIYDFDRCTGMLSNPRTLVFESNAQAYGFATFSPNSRYLYLYLNPNPSPSLLT